MNVDRRLRRRGAEIAYGATEGEGPAVVLTHGAGLDRTTFDAQIPVLAAHGYRVIAWDLRGHGRSTLHPGMRFSGSDARDDLRALLDAIGVARAVLVGHSLGGNLVQSFAGAHPERVAGHVVMGATWNAGPLRPGEGTALRAAAPLLSLIPAARLPGVMARASAVTPSGIARAEAAFARMPRHVFLDVWRATAAFVEPAPAYRAPAPLALVRGAEDRTGNIASAMARWAHASGIDEHVVPAAGHILTWDAPAATSEILLRILRRWDSAADA